MTWGPKQTFLMFTLHLSKIQDGRHFRSITKSIFLISIKQNVVYDIIVHMHTNRFYLGVGGNHFECEGQI